MARRMAREEGILVGGSAGLNVVIACQLARELDDPDALIATILCDTGERYLSKLFNDEWMQENQLLETPRITALDLLQRRTSQAPTLVSLAASAAVRQALNLMNTWDVSQIPVLEGDECIGGLSESNLMTRALAQPGPAGPLRSGRSWTRPFPIVDAQFPADRMPSMLTRESPAALVAQDGKIIGIISRYDVLQQLITQR